MASLAPVTGKLGTENAAHLLRRATFGPSRQEIDQFAEMEVEAAVQALLTFPPLPDHPVDPQTGQTWVITGRQEGNASPEELKYLVNSWYLHQVFRTDVPISAFTKVVFFLHSSFSTSFRDIIHSENHYFTLRLFMHYAAGSYRELAEKICLDNGMNEFLDIGESKEGNPNENFAREFFELFTIGKGPQIGEGDYTHFTEDDIRSAARLLTGFRLNLDWSDSTLWDPDHGMPRANPNPDRHDLDPKVFSEKFGSREIAGQLGVAGMLNEVHELVEMIFAQEQTAICISRRLYRMFVNRLISEAVETDIIQPLAAVLREHDYSVSDALKVLLQSEHFFGLDGEPSPVGSLIKNPLELQAGMVHFFQIPNPNPELDPYHSYVDFYRWGVQQPLSDACFDLFAPPDVAGYEPVFQAPEYQRLWISSKSLPARYQLADLHLNGPDYLRLDPVAFVANPAQIPPFPGPDSDGVPGPHSGAKIATHLVDQLLRYMMAELPPPNRVNYFLHEVLLDTLSEKNWAFEWERYEATQEASAVRPQLTKLIRAIMQSPEYQCG